MIHHDGILYGAVRFHFLFSATEFFSDDPQQDLKMFGSCWDFCQQSVYISLYMFIYVYISLHQFISVDHVVTAPDDRSPNINV